MFGEGVARYGENFQVMPLFRSVMNRTGYYQRFNAVKGIGQVVWVIDQNFNLY